MHGNLTDTLSRYNEVFTDPRASRCVGASLSPERQMRNQLFYDFAFKVFWNPKTVDVDKFLKDYALGRYGQNSLPNMYEFVKKLEESVYDNIAHWSWLMLHSRHIGHFNVYENERAEHAKRFKYIPLLRKALEYALKEKDNLSESKLYRIDLTDTSNQYLQELVNYYVYSVYDAYKAEDKVKFEASAKTLMKCMELMSMVLSSSEYRHLTYFAKLVERRWEATRDDFIYYNPDPSIDKRTLCEKSLDYVKGFAAPNEYLCGDYYELNKHVYTKRMAYMIEKMRENIDNENKHIDYATVFVVNHTELYNSYKADPNNGIKDEEKYKGGLSEAVRDALKRTTDFGPK